MRAFLTRLLVLTLICGLGTGALAARKPKKKMEKPKPPVGEKPDVSRLEPRGIQRGLEMKIKLVGTNLSALLAVKFQNTNVTAQLIDTNSATVTEAWLKVKTPADLMRGAYDFSVVNAKGESAGVKLYVGDLPHVYESQTDGVAKTRRLSWPVSYWGTLNPMGDVDEVEFKARNGQTLVFDLDTKSIGSQANADLILFDETGGILAENSGFDNGDPFLAFTFNHDGIYRIRIADVAAAGSVNHYYRLSMGELPEVVGIFPLSLRTNAESEVELIGYNLEGKNHVKLKPLKAGEWDVPLKSEQWRARRPFKVLVTEGAELVESEPNDTPEQATPIPLPCVVCGRISSASDVDLYRFEAKAGRRLIIETDAARRGSPIDTKIEVLHPDGKPVERVQLQAVRNSAINFRGIDSNGLEVRVDSWQEMAVNNYLYMQGEVCKLFRMPQGPDSGFQFYASAGKRQDYFDTSANDHALDEPCYIVEAHPPGEKLLDNGLPIYPVYYENDDDSDRQLGSDSRLEFTAPADGAYLIRVTDTRGHGGDRFAYRLIVRDPQPDFTVALGAGSPTLNPGTGRKFTLTANRMDRFDGPIRVDLTGAPSGFSISTPLVIQAGLSEADGTINCDTNAAEPTADEIAKIKVTATATVEGKEVAKPVNSFEKIKMGGAAKLLVAFEPYSAMATNFVLRSVHDRPLEITIAPGQIVPAWLKIKRQGQDELVTFSPENFPHGVIIDDIGLNGVLIPKEESERQIFLHAANWVPDTDRLCYMQAKQEGEPTSLPILLHVRRPHPTQTASAP